MINTNLKSLVTEKLVNVIRLIYWEMQERVLTSDGKTEFFIKLEGVV